MEILGSLIAIFGIALSVICITTLLIVIQGWVISTLWGWFIVPTFGLPELTIPIAMGIAMILSITNPRSAKIIKSIKEKKEKAEMIEEITVPLIRPFLVVFVGYIIKTFFI